MFNAVKELIAGEAKFSLTSDIWSSSQSTFSIISITAHFISSTNFEPKMLVLAAKQIKNSHTGINICQNIENALALLGISKVN